MIQPQKREVLFIPFNSLKDAIGAVPKVLRSGMLPVGMEFMGQDIIRLVERYTEKEVPLHDYEAFLLIIVEADTEAELLDASQRISEICRSNGSVDTFLPPSEHARRNLLETREKFYPSVRSLGFVDIADVVVPRSRIADFVEKVKEISAAHDLPVMAYGHAGDGNVHLHPFGVGLQRTEWQSRLAAVFKAIYQAGVALGGTISGEHGLGYEKKQYLGIALDPGTIELMRRVKRAFDPNSIMNPGKVFDLD